MAATRVVVHSLAVAGVGVIIAYEKKKSFPVIEKKWIPNGGYPSSNCVGMVVDIVAFRESPKLSSDYMEMGVVVGVIAAFLSNPGKRIPLPTSS